VRKKKRNEAVSTYLGAGVSVVGTISFKDTIRLDGRVRGKIVSDSGTVVIGEKAVLHADISADVVIIMGEIHGTVDAREKVEAYPPGRVSGDIKAPVIAVEPGVVFDGSVTMKERGTSPKTTTEVKKIAAPLDKAKTAEKVAKNL
jgi:cytoskeletal protein CcmA (bactofilin family)